MKPDLRYISMIYDIYIYIYKYDIQTRIRQTKSVRHRTVKIFHIIKM